MKDSASQKSFQVDRIHVQVYASKNELGRMAASFVAAKLREAVEAKGSANLILATGASQFDFLDAFKADRSVDWSRIHVFHLDEYVHLSIRHPASFRKYLKERILDEVKPARVFLLNGEAEDLDEEVRQYERSLKQYPTDVACIGIGENGHIAFNDPAVADFNDPVLVKVIDLADEACRRQQVGEGWFKTLEEVPMQALTLTIPAMMRSKTISCVVPDRRKAQAVYRTLKGPIEPSCPASVLRTHPDAMLFLDTTSASLV